MTREYTTDPVDPPENYGQRLQPLLAPRSIALLGASVRANSFGRALLDMALGGGFRGVLYPVNPHYAEVSGRRCYPALDALPTGVEHVVLAVAGERLETCLIDAVEHGARAVTIFANCHDQWLQQRLCAIARDSGLLICGPNSMGFHNLDTGLRVTPFPAPLDLVPGGIAAILQSGSVMGALAHNSRRLRFNLLVSPGSELSVSAADYLHWALAQPTTRVIGVFLEAVRDPVRFLSALDQAKCRDVPVVLLKVGRTETARHMAMSHSGAVIGHHGVFQAVARDRGVHLVDTLDELAATLQLFSQGRAAGPGGIASIHDSGGERELLADLASDLQLPLASLGPATVAKIAPHLETGLNAENPLDAWGSGKHAESTFRASIRALMEDDNVAVGLYVLDWRQDYYLHEMHERVISEAAAHTAKPLAAVSNYSLTNNERLAERLADRNIPLLEGTREALQAVKHLLARRTRRCVPAASAEEHPNASYYRTELERRAWVSERFGHSLLADYGIATPALMCVSTRTACLDAARALGLPVVLKTARPEITHKTEVRGVRVDLSDEAAVLAAYDDIASRLGPEVLVCEQVEGRAEWLVGVVNDRDFGPAVTLAPGGILVEFANQAAILIAPFGAADAAAALRELPASRVLTGYRGQPPLAIDALCELAARVSQIASDLRTHIQELDVNPVLVSEHVAVAVDVLIHPRRPADAG